MAEIRRMHKMLRSVIENDPEGKTLPKWLLHCAIGTYREQGWAAFDQNQGGKNVASGAWGECVLLMSDGSISSHNRGQDNG